MTPFRLYAVLAVVGAILPYMLLLPWIARHGLDVPLLLSQSFITIPARIFIVDALFAALVLLLFVLVEGRRLRIPHLWAPALAVLLAGICCALPLFLAQRERALDRKGGWPSARDVSL